MDEHLLTNSPWSEVHLALASLLGLTPAAQNLSMLSAGVWGQRSPRSPTQLQHGAFAIKRLPSPFLLLKPNGTM